MKRVVMADEYTLNAEIYAEIMSAWNLNSPPSRITNADIRMLRKAGIAWNDPQKLRHSKSSPSPATAPESSSQCSESRSTSRKNGR
jgi:hypothetical protein